MTIKLFLELAERQMAAPVKARLCANETRRPKHVALEMGRDFIGCDIAAASIPQSRKRRSRRRLLRRQHIHEVCYV
jgi:hypothetical protein